MCALERKVTENPKENPSLHKNCYSKLISHKIQEETIQIGSLNIHYVKAGSGPHNVLCVPGAFGTMWTDFRPLIEGFDLEKYTLISIDTPGFGKSRPPIREFSKDLHDYDAEIAHKCMQVLGLSKHSLLGWSYGGSVSLIYAAKYPDVVSKMVIWGAHSFITPYERTSFEKIRYATKWSPEMSESRVQLYGEELTTQYCEQFVNGMLARYKDGDICLSFLKDIICPTLILHGEKDPVINIQHAHYLREHIQNSRVYIFSKGKHNLHCRYPEEFNDIVQNFLM